MKKKNCECCFMPLAKDPKESGSDKYCSYCYVDGKLLAEGLTLKEFQKKAYDGMREQKFNWFLAHVFTFLIRFAPYWKNRQKS